MNRLDELLYQYAQAEGQAKLEFELKRVVLDREALSIIEKTVWDEFGVEQAVLVLDMSGFSQGVQSHGIVHSLSMIHRMHIAVEAPVDRYNGSIVKFEADNMFARFPSSEDAIDAGIMINHVLSGMNLMTPEQLDVHVSIGVDFGKFLLIDETDMFGDPINLASKLGEDSGSASEILVTQTAMNLVPEGRFNSEAISISISGVTIPAYRIQF
jgi:class 3 adenylate cyclase